jgi:hypothetical protein
LDGRGRLDCGLQQHLTGGRTDGLELTPGAAQGADVVGSRAAAAADEVRAGLHEALGELGEVLGGAKVDKRTPSPLIVA